jgi:hypothetical protein
MLPPSSTISCSTDQECKADEKCSAWRVGRDASSPLAGPRSCRRSCDNGAPCATDEECLVSLHGGGAIEALEVARLCLPKAPPAGCEGWRCDGCEGLDLGAIADCSMADMVRACTFAIHPKCGLKCELSVIGPCNNIVPLCQQYACSRCPGGAASMPECMNDGVAVCLASKAPALEACAQLCVPVTVAECAHGCVSTSTEAAICAP